MDESVDISGLQLATKPVDRCGFCFEPLKPGPLGSRLACSSKSHRGAKPRYWSEAIPEEPNTQDACLVSKHGRPTLHMYG